MQFFDTIRSSLYVLIVVSVIKHNSCQLQMLSVNAKYLLWWQWKHTSGWWCLPPGSTNFMFSMWASLVPFWLVYLEFSYSTQPFTFCLASFAILLCYKSSLYSYLYVLSSNKVFCCCYLISCTGGVVRAHPWLLDMTTFRLLPAGLF